MSHRFFVPRSILVSIPGPGKSWSRVSKATEPCHYVVPFGHFLSFLYTLYLIHYYHKIIFYVLFYTSSPVLYYPLTFPYPFLYLAPHLSHLSPLAPPLPYPLPVGWLSPLRLASRGQTHRVRDLRGLRGRRGLRGLRGPRCWCSQFASGVVNA